METPNMHITRGELEHRFQFHPADSDNRIVAHQEVRSTLLESADTLVQLTGAPSYEQTEMVKHLELAMFWANASIARSDGPRT